MERYKMLDGYLTVKLIIEHPETKLPITLPAFTHIKINHLNGLAWIKTYQVKLNRHTYCLVN